MTIYKAYDDIHKSTKPCYFSTKKEAKERGYIISDEIKIKGDRHSVAELLSSETEAVRARALASPRTATRLTHTRSMQDAFQGA